jgi:acyl-coenzyme A synthetase/AMP-(fatty) acid ligase
LPVLQRSRPITNRGTDEIIVHGPTGEVSVGTFIARAAKLATQLPDCRYVINLATDRYHFILGFCAAVIAGRCTLMPPNRLQHTVQQVADEYGDCVSLGEDSIDGVDRFEIDFDSLEIAGSEAAIPEIPSQQLCAIVFTSGSTGTPAPNHKYWETLRTGTLGNVELLLQNVSEQLNLLATVPPQHMWGFETSVLIPLFCNVAVCHRTPLFPMDIANALESLPEPRILISSPAHLEAFLASDVAELKLDKILSATAPMSAELAKNLEQQFDAQLIEVFGCSEAGIIAKRSTAVEEIWQLSRLFAVEVNDDGTIVRAAHLPEEVILHDIIELTDEGHFHWHGRHQDMVNIAGKRGSLADLNLRLQAIPGVVDGVIFMPSADSKRLAALVVAPTLAPSDIVAQLRLGIEAAFLPRPIYKVPKLPRQETGKLTKKAIVDLFARTKRSRTTKDGDSADN